VQEACREQMETVWQKAAGRCLKVEPNVEPETEEVLHSLAAGRLMWQRGKRRRSDRTAVSLLFNVSNIMTGISLDQQVLQG